MLESYSLTGSSGSTANLFQFPILLSHAVTVHKTQGMIVYSPNTANMDISSCFEAAQGCVALGRTQEPSQVFIMDKLDPTKIYASSKALEEYANMNDRSVNKNPVEWDNIARLGPHIEDLRTDFNLVRADVIHLCEALVSPDEEPEDVLQLEKQLSGFDLAHYTPYYSDHNCLCLSLTSGDSPPSRSSPSSSPSPPAAGVQGGGGPDGLSLLLRPLQPPAARLDGGAARGHPGVLSEYHCHDTGPCVPHAPPPPGAGGGGPLPAAPLPLHGLHRRVLPHQVSTDLHLVQCTAATRQAGPLPPGPDPEAARPSSPRRSSRCPLLPSPSPWLPSSRPPGLTHSASSPPTLLRVSSAPPCLAR